MTQNKSFATLSIKAGILKEFNKPDKIMSKASAIGTENKLTAYGYQLLNGGQQDKSIEVLTLNTKRFTRSANE